LFALVGLSACGGGIPGDSVVAVDGKGVTKTAFNHWMSVAGASSATTPGSKPVIPDPPNYTACIAHEKSLAPKPAKGQAAPTEATLKSQCEQQYKSLQQEVLGFLVSSEWVLGEANSLGVNISDKEVKKEFEKNQEDAVSEGRGIRKIPSHLGSVRLGPAAARQAEPALAENPEEGRERQRRSQQGRNRQVLQRKPVALRNAGKARGGDHPHQNRSGG
jgi:hypothetical protein